MTIAPGILAKGPWAPDDVRTVWRDAPYVASDAATAQADAAITSLSDRGSPSHDGLAARLASFDPADGLHLTLEPIRWALRLGDDALGSISVQCVVRDGEGRWLAGRRAAWVATWAGRWALGAGGAVEVDENPVETMTRELHEEWGLVGEQTQVDALVCTPNRLVLLVGQVWVATGAEITRDAEHDAHAWWPADPGDWPDDVSPALAHMARLLS